MERQEELMLLAKKSINVIKELIKNESLEGEETINEVFSNGYGDTIIFSFNDGHTIEYSLSEINYIFEDHLKGFEIFSEEKHSDVYNALLDIQRKTENL